MPDVTSVEHRFKAGQVREWLATVRGTEDLLSVGAYVAGSNPRVDEALARREAIESFLRQPAETLQPYDEAVTALRAL
jgi:flagellar biosynthesis/type III secretory pathway ATPase